MTILDYYISKQTDPEWMQKFQSTAQGQYGKLFNCINVNFRSLNTYYIQLDKFKDKDGKRRTEWNDFQDNGQEKDKHRVQLLKNAKFIKTENDIFHITKKGNAALKINENSLLSEEEKWVLMYMLLIDFTFEDNELDIIKSVIGITASLEKCGITVSKFLQLLKESMFVLDKNAIFRSDAFWIITFARDETFINLYCYSTQTEKDQLSEWVINCSNDKNTIDCIAHKFISGGVYTAKMHNEDVNITICTLILLALQDKDYNNFIEILSKLYSRRIRATEIKKIVEEFPDVYKESYANSIGKINKLLKVEG